METQAAPLVVDSGVKALKKVYKVEMPETYDNAMLIMAAFLANSAKCREKTSTTKWFAFNATSAATALSRVKNDDNNFAPKGINFIEVDKL
jgi:plasmid replication initiation protein